MAKTYGAEVFPTLENLLTWMNAHSAQGTPVQILFRADTSPNTWVLIYSMGS